ncbi:MAG: chemotaxis response regulator protein-glutamate methylesterase, partial [Planctomycetota bacterium]
VLIVDDSATVRGLLTEILSGDPQIKIVGSAPDPLVARQMIKELKPDILTLDVVMPRMDGVTFLRNLMRLHPMPVVMISSLTEEGAEITLQALELGAVDFLCKPKSAEGIGLEGYAEEIVAKVKNAARANLRPLERMALSGAARGGRAADTGRPSPAAARGAISPERIIALGASTGGTEAIRVVLEEMPAPSPAVVITQHIPDAFGAAFARRMDSCSAMKVSIAAGGEPILPGQVMIAPGHSHLLVTRKGGRYIARLSDSPPVNRHRPSVDVLFRSVAESAGPHAVGVLLTGMGVDGAQGLLEMRQAGAATIVQDEESSVVWGMPGSAAGMGAAEAVLPLHEVAARALSLALSSRPRAH